MSAGWIRLHRKFLDWEWYDDHNTCRVFIYCLLRANYKDGEYRGTKLVRGQFITSVGKISAGTGITPKIVGSALKKLKLTNDLATQTTNKFTIVTVCNYGSYNDADGSEGKQKDKQGGTQEGGQTGSQRLTNKNIKKERKEEEDTVAALFSLEEKDPTGVSGKAQLADRWNEMAKAHDLPTIRKITGEMWDKFKLRQKEEPEFLDLIELELASLSDFARAGGWFNFRWIIHSEGNLSKLLNGNYRKDDNAKTVAAPLTDEERHLAYQRQKMIDDAADRAREAGQ